MSLTDWYDRWKTKYLQEHKMQSGSADEKRDGMPPAEGKPVPRWVYDGLAKALAKLSDALARAGCQQGADMAEFVDRQAADLHAARLALDVWDDYNRELEDLLREHGWTPGEMKMEWLERRLKEARDRTA